MPSSIRLLVDPLRHHRRNELVHPVQQRIRLLTQQQHGPMLRPHETFFDDMVEEPAQLFIEAIDIEQAQRLGVIAQLPPGPPAYPGHPAVQ